MENFDNDPTGEIRYWKKQLEHSKMNNRDLSFFNLFLFVVIVILIFCLTLNN